MEVVVNMMKQELSALRAPTINSEDLAKPIGQSLVAGSIGFMLVFAKDYSTLQISTKVQRLARAFKAGGSIGLKVGCSFAAFQLTELIVRKTRNVSVVNGDFDLPGSIAGGVIARSLFDLPKTPHQFMMHLIQGSVVGIVYGSTQNMKYMVIPPEESENNEHNVENNEVKESDVHEEEVVHETTPTLPLDVNAGNAVERIKSMFSTIQK
jgi:uncharacterized membrane-anchored protein YitT (DUF2179 family)